MHGVSKVCTAYQELAARATATTCNAKTVYDSAGSSNERFQPVPAQQTRLLKAHEELEYCFTKRKLPKRQPQFKELSSVVTEALAAGKGICVYVHGPPGAGKTILVRRQLPTALDEWCSHHQQPKPVHIDISSVDLKMNNPAGLFSAILQQLKLTADKRIVLSAVSGVAAEAQQQLQALALETTRSNSSSDMPMVVVKVDGTDQIAQTHTQELQQLFEMTAGSRLILVACGESDLAQTLPLLQQQHSITPVQVECTAFTERNLVGLLNWWVEDAVQPVAREYCWQSASGSLTRAQKLCHLAVKLALSDCNSSSDEVTLSHMKHAVRLAELGCAVFI